MTLPGVNTPAVSAPMQIILLLTVLTLLPAIVMSITPFLRITIVLHFLRQALGTQTVPSNQVLIGLSLTLCSLLAIPVTNASLNPARSTGAALVVGGWALDQLWLFWAAPLVGGVLAGLVHPVLQRSAISRLM